MSIRYLSSFFSFLFFFLFTNQTSSADCQVKRKGKAWPYPIINTVDDLQFPNNVKVRAQLDMPSIRLLSGIICKVVLIIFSVCTDCKVVKTHHSPPTLYGRKWWGHT